MVCNFSDGISSCNAPWIKSWGRAEFTTVRPHCSGVEVLFSAAVPQPPMLFQPNFFWSMEGAAAGSSTGSCVLARWRAEVLLRVLGGPGVGGLVLLGLLHERQEGWHTCIL